MKRLLILAGLYLTACASAHTHAPVPSVDIPELPKKEGGYTFGVNTHPGYYVIVVENAMTRPADLTTGPTQPATQYLVDAYGGVQFLEIFAAHVGLTQPEGGIFVKLQAQLLGEPSEKAEEGNVSLLLSFEDRYFSSRTSGTSKVALGPGGYSWSAESTSWSNLISLSLGYRFTPHTLLFFGGGMGNGGLKTKINQDPAEDNSDNGFNYNIERTFTSGTWALGMDLSNGNHHFIPKAQLNYLSYDRKSRQDHAFGFEWHWDIKDL